MEELINTILYGKLEVEIPTNLTLKQQLEVIRAILASHSSSIHRIKMCSDVHPWVNMLFREMQNNNNGSSV